VAGEATRKSSSRCTSATTACSTEADDLQVLISPLLSIYITFKLFNIAPSHVMFQIKLLLALIDLLFLQTW
jgi:hypothetical protein